MKRNCRSASRFVVLFSCAVVILAFAEALLAQFQPLSWRAASRDAVSTTWEASEGTNVHRFVEVASGLNYATVTGYQPSEDLIQLTTDGSAAAVHGPAKLYVKPNLNSDGAITIITTSNRVFATRPIAVVWYNAQSGQTALIASVQDCAAELVPPNTIVWKGAFGALGDLRLAYTKSAIECDLVILRVPASPPNWDPRFCRLELWSEWSGAPSPAIEQRLLHAETDANLRSQMLDPDVTDQILDFGDLWFPTGTAYATDGAAEPALGSARQIRVSNLAGNGALIGVAKTWLDTPLGNVLAEGVRWADVRPRLQDLPTASTTFLSPQAQDRLGLLLQLPLPDAAPSGQAIKLATSDYRPVGFVLDWTGISGGGDYTFASGQTYYVTNSGYFSGTLTFQPGCVIKYGPNAWLLTYGSIACNGSSYNPSILTSRDDDLFGETLAGISTHVPTYAANEAVWAYYMSGPATISGMRIRWACVGAQIDSYASGNTVSDCQFELCQTGVFSSQGSAISVSGTMCGVQTPFSPTESITGSLTDICGGNDWNGLPYIWEYQYFGQSGIDPNADPDADGLTNAQEYQYQTNPMRGDPPIITTQPAGPVVVPFGGNASFAITVANSGATYQWEAHSYFGGFDFNWRPIAGATSRILSLANEPITDDGNSYRVIVSNPFGQTISTKASLAVLSSFWWPIWQNYVTKTAGKSGDIWTGDPCSNPSASWDPNSVMVAGWSGWSAITKCDDWGLPSRRSQAATR